MDRGIVGYLMSSRGLVIGGSVLLLSIRGRKLRVKVVVLSFSFQDFEIIFKMDENGILISTTFVCKPPPPRYCFIFSDIDSLSLIEIGGSMSLR